MIPEIISIGCGVLTMIGWGCGDFLIKRVVASVGYYRLMLYAHLVGLAPLSLLAAVYGSAVFFPPILSSPRTIALVIAIGICNSSSISSFYKALAVGKASVITPVASTSAIVAMVLSFAILGETLSFSQILCIAFALTGVVIVSMKSGSEGPWSAGIHYALVCVFAAGLTSVLIKLLSTDVGPMAALFHNRLLVTVILLMTAPLFQKNLFGRIEGRLPLTTIVLIGLAQFLGYFALIIGVAVGIVSIVMPVSNASPVVTVVLAQVFLQERLVQIQKIAVALVIVGILLLSIVSV